MTTFLQEKLDDIYLTEDINNITKTIDLKALIKDAKSKNMRAVKSRLKSVPKVTPDKFNSHAGSKLKSFKKHYATAKRSAKGDSTINQKLAANLYALVKATGDELSTTEKGKQIAKKFYDMAAKILKYINEGSDGLIAQGVSIIVLAKLFSFLFPILGLFGIVGALLGFVGYISVIVGLTILFCKMLFDLIGITAPKPKEER